MSKIEVTFGLKFTNYFAKAEL